MAKFDEKKVINALHPEKAEVGKKYWYSDSVTWLKRKVENNEPYATLKGFGGTYFEVDKSEDLYNKYLLLYPYEEPPKQRMTNRQLAEWLAKGNGERKGNHYESIRPHHCYYSDEGNDFVDDILIRTWGSDEWIEPIVDIYERDCKGGKK